MKVLLFSLFSGRLCFTPFSSHLPELMPRERITIVVQMCRKSTVKKVFFFLYKNCNMSQAIFVSCSSSNFDFNHCSSNQIESFFLMVSLPGTRNIGEDSSLFGVLKKLQPLSRLGNRVRIYNSYLILPVPKDLPRIFHLQWLPFRVAISQSEGL